MKNTLLLFIVPFFFSACMWSSREEKKNILEKEITEDLTTPIYDNSKKTKPDSINWDLLTASNDSVSLMLKNVLIAYTPDNKKETLDSLKIVLNEKKADPNALLEVQYSQRKLGTYIPIIKHFYKKKYRYHSILTYPVHLATETNNINMVKTLVEAGADMNKVNQNYELPADIALRFDNVEMLNYFIAKGVDVRKINLANTQNVKIIDYLIEYGANPNTIDLNFAVKDRKLLEHLLEYNIDLNQQNFWAENICADTELLKLLVEKGLNPNITTKFPDDCPLIYGVIKYSDDKEALEFLLNKKARLDIECANNFADNPLIMCVKMKKTDFAELLIKQGVDVDKAGWEKRTPLLYAIDEDDSKMINLLLKNGANLEYNEYFDKTPLLYAADFQKYIAAETLLKNGANVNYVNKQHENSVIFAIKNNDLAMLKLLFEYNADKNYNYKKQTLVEYAKSQEASETILQLLTE